MATRGRAAGLLLTVWVATVGPAAAQPVADHLECFKVKDSLDKATYTADLGGLVAETGCTVKVPAKYACVPSAKTNVVPNPPGGGGTGPARGFACYKVKCPKGALPPVALYDQFGSRSATPTAAKLLCTPLASTTTTTSTTTSSTLGACLADGQNCLAVGDAGCCSGCCSGPNGVCTTPPNCCMAFWTDCCLSCDSGFGCGNAACQSTCLGLCGF